MGGKTMKRHSITMIIGIAQVLTERANYYRHPADGGENMKKYLRYTSLIRRAAVNEIIRLEAESELAAERSMPGLKKRFDEIDKS